MASVTLEHNFYIDAEYIKATLWLLSNLKFHCTYVRFCIKLAGLENIQ
jgi:hypothetical protein